MNWSTLIDSNLGELIESSTTGSKELYRQALIHYLRNDSDKLRDLKNDLSLIKTNNTLTQLLLALIQLRLEIRLHEISVKQIHTVLDLSDRCPELIGEGYFVAALAFEKLGDEIKSYQYYTQAQKHLESMACPKKAIKAGFNGLAAKSRIDPDRMYSVDYFHLIRKAKKFRCYSVVGMAYSNISFEYLKIGASSSALKAAQYSVGFLRRYDFGSLDYYTAVAQRCHVWIELGLHDRALNDLRELEACPFAEIVSVGQIISRLRKDVSASTPKMSSFVPASWRERWETIKSIVIPVHVQSTLSNKNSHADLEDKLIQILSQGAKDKYDIISALYGDLLSLEVTENRLKNLIHRVRKRKPNLIQFFNGKYQIANSIPGLTTNTTLGSLKHIKA